MRLIDADALMQEFAEFVRHSNNSDYADIPTWNDAVSLVGSAPTIDPVKHGVWLKAEKGGEWWYACSICSSHIPKTLWGQDWHSSYCPNCGARMEGEEDDPDKD